MSGRDVEGRGAARDLRGGRRVGAGLSGNPAAEDRPAVRRDRGQRDAGGRLPGALPRDGGGGLPEERQPGLSSVPPRRPDPEAGAAILAGAASSASAVETADGGSGRAAMLLAVATSSTV